MIFNLIWIFICSITFGAIELDADMLRGMLNWGEYPTLIYLTEAFLGNWFITLGLTNFFLWILTAIHLFMNNAITLAGKSIWFVLFILIAFIFNFIYWYLYLNNKSITSNLSSRKKPPLT